MTAAALAIILVGIAALPPEDNANEFIAEHKARQRSRIEYRGWTLPGYMCGLWWIGLEHVAPNNFRRTTA